MSVLTPFPQNSFGWEYKPRSSLCTHVFYHMDWKDPDIHVLDWWMPAKKTTHTPSMHHPQRRNVTTSMVGLNKTKKQSHIKGSQPEWCISSMIYSRDTPFWSGTLDMEISQNGESQRYRWERRRRYQWPKHLMFWWLPCQVFLHYRDSARNAWPTASTVELDETASLMCNLIIIIMIIIIADFVQSPHNATDCLQHVRSSGPSAIMHKSRATHRALITCNMSCATWYKGTAQLLSLTEFKSHLF